VGVVVVLYHLWSYIRVNKYIEMMTANREKFVQIGGSLGIPLWGLPAEAFTNFSFPYQRNDNCFYSYHDPVNKRNCPCDKITGVCTCQANGNCSRSGPQATPLTTSQISAAENFTGSMDNAAVHAGVIQQAKNVYGMKPVVPVMGRNPIA
jgi:hypothetical protein